MHLPDLISVHQTHTVFQLPDLLKDEELSQMLFLQYYPTGTAYRRTGLTQWFLNSCLSCYKTVRSPFYKRYNFLGNHTLKNIYPFFRYRVSFFYSTKSYKM